ncbi:MAG: HNH endonuclease [Patescibacteria group bacterium]|jgi:5-methylcytosine-specific restriction endonuclease McrA
MARIRTIKPDFWTDGKIVQLPFEARLLFIGMWNFADDSGFLGSDLDRIKMQIFPSDEIDIYILIDLLCNAELLGRTDGSLKIHNFTKHQRIAHPTPSRFEKTHESSRKITIPSSVRKAIALKYGCKPGEDKEVNCYYCGKEGRIHWWRNRWGKPTGWINFSLTLDHVNPESLGGETKVENMVLACAHCNKSKGVFDYPRELSRKLTPDLEVEVEVERKGRSAEETKTPRQPKSVDGSFATFWEHYPRRVSKGAAEKAWNKIKPSPELLTTILAKLVEYEASDQWKDEQYIPHPSTWLNRKGWEDEVPAPKRPEGELSYEETNRRLDAAGFPPITRMIPADQVEAHLAAKRAAAK